LTTEKHPTGRPSRAQAEAAARILLEFLNEDLARAGVQGTPERIVRGLEDMTWGLRAKPPELRLFEAPEADPGQPVLVRGIEFASLCEHHLLPFWGIADLAYLPAGGKVLGLSKIPRLVHFWAARPQLQERLTFELARELGKAAVAPRDVGEEPAFLREHLDVFVRLRAQHACMLCRGVRSGAETVTVAACGQFRDGSMLREQVDTQLIQTR